MKEAIIFHHTADSSPDPQFWKVEAYHKSLKFPKSSLGFFCGYHYFIGKSGDIKQARTDDERGAHTVNCGCGIDETGWKYDEANEKAIGICLAGDFTKENPTDHQIASLCILTESLQKNHGIMDIRLFNHRETKKTACPGMDLKAEVIRINRIRKQLAAAESAVKKVSGNRKTRLQIFIERAKGILVS